MIELYHFAFSTCSQKVRLVLEEKGIDFVSHEVNILGGGQHDPEYVKLNPMHVVPTLVHDGHVLIESSLIIKYLDDAFPEPPMRPVDALGRYSVDGWIKRIDDALHPAAPTVTFALGPRNIVIAQPAAEREASIAAIPDPIERATRRSVLEHGIEAPEFAGALRVFLDALDEMETALADRLWLSGDRFGLADASLLPYVLRLEHLGLDPVLDSSTRPGVAGWLSRVKALPSYERAVEAWAAPAVVEMMRVGASRPGPSWSRLRGATAWAPEHGEARAWDRARVDNVLPVAAPDGRALLKDSTRFRCVYTRCARTLRGSVDMVVGVLVRVKSEPTMPMLPLR
jgi:glutathione S-transferase